MCVWNMAADIFSFDDTQIENVLYTNRCIDKFLKSEQSMGVFGSKPNHGVQNGAKRAMAMV